VCDRDGEGTTIGDRDGDVADISDKYCGLGLSVGWG